MSKPGQGRSTFSDGDPRPFQQWLRAQLDHYGWSYGRLARELDMSKGAVPRWFSDPDDGTFRRPAYATLKLLSNTFGVELAYLLDLAGVSEDDDAPETTQRQREAAAIVSVMPDAILSVLLPQLRALATIEERDRVMKELRTYLTADGE